MKADATAEKRPAYPFVSEICVVLAVKTHKYQGGVEVIAVLFLKSLVIFVGFLPELFVETGSSIWLLLRESHFHCGSQVITKPRTMWH